MNKANFDELLQSVEEMDTIAAGQRKPARKFEFSNPRVKHVREKIGLSQAKFAMLIGVSKRTLENWEQGRRHPSGPAKVLLRILDADPKHAVEALYHQ
jgi:putative transcriptional regulator